MVIAIIGILGAITAAVLGNQMAANLIWIVTLGAISYFILKFQI